METDNSATWILWLILALTALSQPVLAQGHCNSSLGMENGNISDHQITCYPSVNCHRARLNRQGVGWVRADVPLILYSQVDLLRVKRVTKIAMQAGYSSYMVNNYRVYYSEDGEVWHVYRSFANSSFLGEELTGNADSETTVWQNLTPPIEARYIVLHPTRYPNGYFGMKYELYGCDVETTGQITTSTSINEDIQDDRVLVKSLSPYVINRTVNIQYAATLTIQAGVRILFTTPEAKLVVFGRLQSEGVSNDRVVFSSNSNPLLSDPKGQWTGIQKKEDGEISLTKTDIWQAVTGIRGSAPGMNLVDIGAYMCKVGLEFTSGNVNNTANVFRGGNIYACDTGITLSAQRTASYYTFQDYNIVKNQQHGIEVLGENCGVTITNSIISENQQNGVSASRDILSIQMDHVILESNMNSGVKMRGTTSGFDISFCDFKSNGGCSIDNTAYTNLPPILISIRNSTFNKNENGAVCTMARKINLIGNNFTNNKGDYAFSLNNYGSEEDRCNIIDNVFHRNYKGAYIKAESNVTFIRNLVSGTRSPYAVYLDCENLEFSHNRIVNSSSSVAIFVKSLPRNPLSFNVLNNPNSDFEISTDIRYAESQVLDARYNYWGWGDIVSRIQNIFSDLDFTVILFTPFFTTDSMEEFDTGADKTVFSRDGDQTIGGRLTEDVVLDRNTVFHVTRSICVPVGVTLTLEAGAELRFLENRGILVLGSLNILGEEDHNVILTGEEGKQWSGVRGFNASCSLAFVVISGVKSSCLEFTDMSVSMSSMWLTDAESGIISTFRTKSSDFNNVVKKISLNDIHISETTNAIDVKIGRGVSVEIELENSTISSSSGTAVGIRSTDESGYKPGIFRMKRCIFSQNWKAVDLELKSSGSMLNVFIEDCEFGGQYFHDGVRLALNNSTVTIINSVFKSLESGIVLQLNGDCRDVKVQNNTFEATDNVANDIGVFAEFGNSDNTDICTLHILDNIFSGSRAGNVYNGKIIQIWTENGPRELNISKNRVLDLTNSEAISVSTKAGTDRVSLSGNQIFDCGKAISVIAQHPSTHVLIQNNLIYRNTGTEIIRLSPRGNQGKSIEFSRNVLVNNTNSVMKITAPKVVLNYNVFHNPDSVYALELDETEAFADNVDATLNYWDAVSLQEIGRKLHDHVDNTGLPWIAFSPYFADRNFTTIYEDTSAFVSMDGTIGGSVHGTVILSLQGGPYTTVNDIMVYSGNTLVVEAGVQIQFRQNIGIIVEGQLEVRGDNETGVEFVSEIPGQKWRGITFVYSDEQLSKLKFLLVNDTTDGIKILRNPPEMESVSVLHSSGDGLQFIQPVQSKNFTIKGLTAMFNRISGIYVEFGEWESSGYLRIMGCNVQNNRDFSLRVQGGGQLEVSNCTMSESRTAISIQDTVSGALVIRSCDFHDNSDRMLKLSRTEKSGQNFTFLLQGCLIHNHQPYSWKRNSLIDIEIGPEIKNSSWNFIGNRFYDNSVSAAILKVESLFSGSNSINVSGNTFTNINAQAVYVTTDKWSSAALLGNMFENVTSYKNRPVIFMNPKTSDVVLRGNVFLRNRGTSILLIISYTSITNSNLLLVSNEFVNNSATDIVQVEGVMGFRLHENIFINTNASCEIKAPRFQDLPPIDARRCYWGFKNLDKILPRVCAFEKDMRLSPVDILPFLLSENTEDVMNYTGEFSVDSLAGGVLSESMVMSAQEQPYLISRSIYVESHAELLVEAGVTVEFLENRGIVIKGQAKIGSGTGNTTILRGSEILRDEKWEGITFLPSDSTAPSQSKAVTTFNKTHGSTGVNSSSNESLSYLSHVIMDRSRSGLVLGRSEISLLKNRISNTQRNGVTIIVENATFDFGDTVVEGSGKYGILSSRCFGIVLTNVTITQTFLTGLVLGIAGGRVVVDHVTIANNRAKAIFVDFYKNQEKYFTLSNSRIVNQTIRIFDRAVRINAEVESDRSRGIEIRNNYFDNNINGAIDVDLSDRYSKITSPDRTCNITGNTFVNNGAIKLEVSGFSSLNVSSNDFLETNNTRYCALSVASSKWTDKLEKRLTLSNNRFVNGGGKCAVSLSIKDYQNTVGSFVYNQIVSYQSTEASVLLDAVDWTFTDNVMDNPQATHEVRVTEQRLGMVNARRNWWRGANGTKAKQFVFDGDASQSLLDLAISPVRRGEVVNCSEINSFRESQKCARCYRRHCYTTRVGSSCTEYDCAGFRRCSDETIPSRTTTAASVATAAIQAATSPETKSTPIRETVNGSDGNTQTSTDTTNSFSVTESPSNSTGVGENANPTGSATDLKGVLLFPLIWSLIVFVYNVKAMFQEIE